MIKNIIKDIEFLKQKSTNLTKDELYVVTDLRDTLNFNRHHCVGMAANMIGYLKNVIIFENSLRKLDVLINPIILKKSDEYEAEEGCLSLDFKTKVKRYKKIKVQYLNEDFQIRIKTFTNFEAQIIEHEIDHLLGIIV